MPISEHEYKKVPVRIERREGLTDDEQDMDLMVTMVIPHYNKFERLPGDMRAMVKELHFAGFGPTHVIVGAYPSAETTLEMLKQQERDENPFVTVSHEGQVVPLGHPSLADGDSSADSNIEPGSIIRSMVALPQRKREDAEVPVDDLVAGGIVPEATLVDIDRRTGTVISHITDRFFRRS